MPDPKAPDSAAPWHILVGVEEVPETGQHFDLVADANDALFDQLVDMVGGSSISIGDYS